MSSITDKELATFNRVKAILQFAQGKEKITKYDVATHCNMSISVAAHNLKRMAELKLLEWRRGEVKTPTKTVTGSVYKALTGVINKDAYFAATKKVRDTHQLGVKNTYNFIAPNLPSAKVTIPKGKKSNMKPSEEKHGGSGGYTTGWYGGTSSIVSANVHI